MTEAMSFDIHLEMDFDRALGSVVAALEKEGFGVLTRVDVHEAFKKKLDVEFRPYAILGACNPRLAHRALDHCPEAGLLLPCNVTIESEAEGRCLVRIVNPHEMMKAAGLDDDPTLSEVGREAHERLRRVAASLAV